MVHAMTSTSAPAQAPDAAPDPDVTLASHAAREAWTVLRHEFGSLFLSTRMLVPMLVYGGFGGLAMLMFVKIGQAAREKAVEAGLNQQALDETLGEGLGKVLEFVGWGDQGTAAEILRDHVPLVELSFFAAACYFLPLLVALVSFDQFSDLSTRGARFALLRVRRWSYFVGKSLAAAASVAGFLAVMWIVVVAIVIYTGESGTAWYAAREGLRSWALMCVLSLPYLGITALVSSFAKPGLAFVGTFGVYIGISIANTIAHHLPDTISRVLEPVLLPLFPWEHAPKLISREPLFGWFERITSYARSGGDFPWPHPFSGVLGGCLSLGLIALAVYGLTGTLLRRRDV